MRRLWDTILAALTPSVRIMLAVLFIMSLLAGIGRLSNSFDLYKLFGLSGPDFWSFQYWRLLTYPMLVTGVVAFLFNGIPIECMGGIL